MMNAMHARRDDPLDQSPLSRERQAQIAVMKLGGKHEGQLKDGSRGGAGADQ